MVFFAPGNCADLDVKPAWWKELIAKIRAFLREKFPSLAFANRDIEGVISTAYRYVRRGRGAEQSDGMEKSDRSDRSDGAGDDEQESTEDDRAFPAITVPGNRKTCAVRSNLPECFS